MSRSPAAPFGSRPPRASQTMDRSLSRPTKSAKTASAVPMSSLTNMFNVALRHTFRFADARKLAAAECLNLRLAQVARAAVVEVADKRYGITLEPVSGARGCCWCRRGCPARVVWGWRFTVIDYWSVLTDGLGAGVREGLVSWGTDLQMTRSQPKVPKVIESLTERVTCVASGASGFSRC